MTEHRKPSRSRSRSKSKSRSGSRSAHSDKHKQSKSKDVYFEDDDSNSEAQFTPSESSEEPSRHGRGSRSSRKHAKHPTPRPHLKSCCRAELARIKRLTAGYAPQHIMESDPAKERAYQHEGAIRDGKDVCRYHGRDGNLHQRLDMEKAWGFPVTPKRKQKEKEKLKHKYDRRPTKKTQPKTRRQSHRHAKHEDTESDDSLASVYDKRHFRNDSRKVMGVFGDKNATENLYVFGKRHPAFATFHRLLYMAFKQVGVPKPVSLMPKREEAYWKKRAKRNKKL